MVGEADGFPALRTLFPLFLRVCVFEPGSYVDDFAERIIALTNVFWQFFQLHRNKKTNMFEHLVLSKVCFCVWTWAHRLHPAKYLILK